jgi:cephalosporin hydroxylase
MSQASVDRFPELYYDSPDRTWGNTWWMGVRTYKCSLDLWIYQKIVCELKPDLVTECGGGEGGTALYIAHILDLIGTAGRGSDADGRGWSNREGPTHGGPPSERSSARLRRRGGMGSDTVKQT